MDGSRHAGDMSHVPKVVSAFGLATVLALAPTQVGMAAPSCPGTVNIPACPAPTTTAPTAPTTTLVSTTVAPTTVPPTTAAPDDGGPGHVGPGERRPADGRSRHRGGDRVARHNRSGRRIGPALDGLLARHRRDDVGPVPRRGRRRHRRHPPSRPPRSLLPGGSVAQGFSASCVS